MERAQISVEFLIYIAIGISALAFGIYASTPMRNSYYSSISKGELYSFADYIEQMQQYGSVNFEAFVPESICSCSTGGSEIRCGNMSFGTGGAVVLANSVCEHAGSIENLTEYYQENGTYYVGAYD
ncbi:MAG: hypothetical protein M1544_01455 [Candidatus Marsarchaeota archaeon]|nr:hypothetical protein [Candidatus Marsarchaeota archaeon]MCL5102004.1 hypothetical protein [Candidatus Marsarchaeota archaeon]